MENKNRTYCRETERERERERGKTNFKKRKKQRQGLKKEGGKKQTNKTEFGIEEKRASLGHDRDRNEGRR